MLWIGVDKFIKYQKPNNLEELNTVIQDDWKSIPIEKNIRLIQSMSQKCNEIIKQKGLVTRY